MTPGLPRARKRFGQHFLEPAWVAKVVAEIAPRRDDVFVEIGPGRGAITLPLAASARAVLACEIDRDLAAHLRATAPANVTVLEADFLALTPADLERPLSSVGGVGQVRIAGNLPYNIGAPILFRLTELFRTGVPLVDATLMLQHEVAMRLTAAPGTRDYSPLTVLIGRHAAIERLLSLPPGAFRPPPKVRSALVRLRFRAPAIAARDEALLAAMVQAVFSRRRKTIGNALLAFAGSARLDPHDALEQAQLDSRRRPETLDAGELVRLADTFAAAR